MKTVICEQPGQLALAERAMPNAGRDDVLVRILRVGICGTDFHIFTGNQPYLSYPRCDGKKRRFKPVIELAREFGVRVEQPRLGAALAPCKHSA